MKELTSYRKLHTLSGKRIFFAVMDWGLGHATRSVPIIKMLSEKNEVIIASSGSALNFLKNYFPELNIIEKPGYNIRYSKIVSVPFSILLKTGSIFHTISSEKKWLENQLHLFKADLIISDNCYGFYHPKIESIIISHQLMLKMPGGFQFAERFVHQRIARLIGKFDQCWVPDYADPNNNLSGDLSHKYPVQKNVSFIGPLSRFTGMRLPMREKDIDVVYIVSGPEPARTGFYEKCLAESQRDKLKAVIIAGLPHKIYTEQVGKTTIFSHLPDERLVDLILRAEKVVCRSGYSTIMDLHALDVKTRFTPTPGQTEQEYLAIHMNRRLPVAYSR